ncbi:MAG: DUF2076 domain-containing protein [Xanthobacteraceae bacterium]|jgi:hypothetical protein|nr:DUF2076 domain-containing protein [Xanthobacteraceae bacterium]MBV9240307.1 DUF2076 domain-containing protein [Xanthobacteraceae bacterium]
MTPQERDLVAALFDRLAGLEGQPRDPEAERLMTQGLTRAPHAIYPLVQTVLLQEEALKRANARIEELEAKTSAEPQPPPGGFLDNMRGALFGRAPGGSGDARGSVPSVRPSGVWNTGQAGAAPVQPPYQQVPGPAMAGPMGGGSFLGTAAAAAVGTIGGSLLFNGIRNLMGGGHPAAFGNYNDPFAAAASPWASDTAGSDLARGAGVNDVNDVTTGDFGSSRFAGDDTAPGAGAYDANDADTDQPTDDDFADSDYGDDGTTDV